MLNLLRNLLCKIIVELFLENVYQAEALTHARRARDLLLFASHASGKERDIARELVGTLEAGLENNAF